MTHLVGDRSCVADKAVGHPVAGVGNSRSELGPLPLALGYVPLDGLPLLVLDL